MAAPPWVILHRTLHPAKDDNISVALRELPRVTVLNVPKSIHPDACHADKFPYLIAAGPSTLLLCFSNMSTDNTGLMVVRQFVPSDKYNNLRRATTTCVAERIPQRTGSMPVKYDLGSVGLAPTPFGGYLIAELQVTRRSERAKLLIFTDSGRWYQLKPLYPMSAEERDWAPAGVVAHNGRLWWFDLSWGILSCDPSVVNPVLRFHKLPPNRGLGRFEPFIHCIRCISVSDNEVRYAEIGRYPDGWHGEDKVFVWTMTWIPASPRKSGPPSKFPPNSEPPTFQWVKSYEMRFSDLWSDITYKTTPLLVNEIPEILFVSPRQPNVVYFFLDRFVFGVDVADSSSALTWPSIGFSRSSTTTPTRCFILQPGAASCLGTCHPPLPTTSCRFALSFQENVVDHQQQLRELVTDMRDMQQGLELTFSKVIKVHSTEIVSC